MRIHKEILGQNIVQFFYYHQLPLRLQIMVNKTIEDIIFKFRKITDFRFNEV